MQLDILHVIIVLLLRRKGKLGGFVELISITFTRNGHHHIVLVRSEDGIILHHAIMLWRSTIIVPIGTLLDSLTANCQSS